MDQALLVKSDRDIGAKVFAALTQSGIPITLFEWMYVPQLEEWQLVIASPWVETKGLHTANRALVDALRRAGFQEDVPMRRVFLRSPNDSIVRALQRELTEQNRGFLHILKNKLRNKVVYSLFFAPIASAEGFAPMKVFETRDELNEFLTETLQLKPRSVHDVLDDVERTDVGSLYPIDLTTRQIKRSGLT